MVPQSEYGYSVKKTESHIQNIKALEFLQLNSSP